MTQVHIVIQSREGETVLEGFQITGFGETQDMGPSKTHFESSLSVHILRIMWGCCGQAFEELCDGFGPGMGTGEGDWSAIRDSSHDAKTRMLAHSLNVLEEMVDWCGEWELRNPNIEDRIKLVFEAEDKFGDQK